MNDRTEHLQVDQIDGLISAAGIDGAREIMDTFWQSTADLLESVATQIADGAFDLAAQTAHAIKGSAANVGALRLSKSAAEMETACKGGSTEEANRLLEDVKSNFSEVKSHFDRHLANA